MFCKMPVISKDVRGAMTSCTTRRFSGLNSLPIDLYLHISVLVGVSLVDNLYHGDGREGTKHG